MKKLLLFIFVAFFSFPSMSQEGKLHEIINKIQTYYQYNPSEKVFLSTNKEIFKPGETIWFSALVDCYTNLEIKNLSQGLTVQLYSSDGTKLLFDNYQIRDGRSSGDIVLPDKLEPGRYFLAAYTQLARTENDGYLKMIFVDNKDEEQIVVEPIQIPSILKSGKDNNVKYYLSELSEAPYRSGKLKYKLYEGDQLLLERKVKAEKNGTVQLNLSLPDKEFNKSLTLKMFDGGGHLDYQKNFQVDSEKLQLDFSAEGGSFIAGKPVKVGFKVKNGVGQLVDIEFDLIDESGTKISQGRTLIPGYGMFPFIGEESKKYKLKITSEVGNGKVFELPSFKNEGLFFSIQKTGDDLFLASIMFAEEGEQDVFMLISRGGYVSWASALKVKGGLRLKLPKENFPAGLSSVSIFNTNGELLSERIVYVDKKENSDVQLKTSNQKITAGQPINMAVSFADNEEDANSGKLTVSVSAVSECIKGINEFVSCYKINTELENKLPTAHLMERGENFVNVINYLLISSKLKNFSWDDILEFDPEKTPEDQSGAGGVVFDADKRPVKNAKISLVNRQNMQILTKTSDSKGYFFFSGVEPDDISNYAVEAIGIDGSKDLTVEFEKSFDTLLSEEVQNNFVYYSDISKPTISKEYYENNRSLFQRIQKPKNQINREPAYKAYLQTATNLLDVVKQIKQFSLEGDKIVFPGSRNSLMAQDGALIVIDGQQLGTSASTLNGIPPVDVETINVSTNAMDIQRYTGLNSVGVIEITTKRGEFSKPVETTTNVKYENGFRVANDFMEIQEESQNESNTTLYWNASVDLDSSAPLNLKIPTADVVGEFLIEVESIDEQGRIGKASKIVEVVK